MESITITSQSTKNLLHQNIQQQKRFQTSPSENTIYRGQRRTIHYTQHYFQASLLLGPELECLCSLRRHYHCSSPPRRRPPSFATRKNLRLCRNQC
ncbi:hypothetical protein K1719_036000 [Acacia pycnantha]|nr:hypothetical protein K1719_036000 [Acacia pycnantha]